MSVPAVIAERSLLVTENVEPVEPTEIALAPFGWSVTKLVPALTVPENETSLAVMVIGEFVVLIDLVAALVTLPAPSVVIVTPPVPVTLPFKVIEPPEPEDVCRTTVFPDMVRGLKTVMVPLAASVTAPLVDVTFPVMPRVAEAPVVVTEKSPPTDEVVRKIAPALLMYAAPELPVLADKLWVAAVSIGVPAEPMLPVSVTN